MYDCVCERRWNGRYRNRQSLAVDVLLTLFLLSVVIRDLIEHDVLESVVVGRPFEMPWKCCLIVVKQEPGMSALAPRRREENDFITAWTQSRSAVVGEFPRREQHRKANNRRPTPWICA